MDTLDFDSIRTYCLSKQSAQEDTPFGPGALVYKVGGKMFGLLTFDGEDLRINLKNAPDVNIELRERFGYITPGYHMNKKHWNTILIRGSIDQDFLFSLIDQSYEMVKSSLPRKIKEGLGT